MTMLVEQVRSYSNAVETAFLSDFVLARFIKEQLIEDFANKSALSDWFPREDAPTPTVVVKKPNPKNIQNAEKIKKLEEQILRYAL